MAKRNYLFTFLILSCVFSCNNAVTQHPGTDNDTTAKTDTTALVPQAVPEQAAEDTVTTIKFAELTISISRLIIDDENKQIDLLQKDTAVISAEVGERPEGQQISVSTDQLTNIKIEQQYETSMAIGNEGPHCDLLNWKHYDSDWKQLKSTGNEQFIFDSYTELEGEKFPSIKAEELKEEVKKHCGEDWSVLLSNIKSKDENPAYIGISSYSLRITGQRTDNGQTVIKLIIIGMPMGC